MNRRTFLKHVSLTATGFTLPGLLAANRVQAAEATGFQLTAITDDPDALIARLEPVFQKWVASASHIQFSEYQLVGEHLADLVLVRDGKLFNFYREQNDLAAELRNIARTMDMPKAVQQPYVLKFSHRSTIQVPETIQIFSGNRLLNTLSLRTDRDDIRIPGALGQVVLAVRHGSAKIVHADCRHKTCMKMGTIQAPGDHLVCIPNQIRITITGKSRTRVDGVVY